MPLFFLFSSLIVGLAHWLRHGVAVGHCQPAVVERSPPSLRLVDAG